MSSQGRPTEPDGEGTHCGQPSAGGRDANRPARAAPTSAAKGSWADFPPFPRMVIWAVLQSISSTLSPTTSPARTPSLASRSKIAWFRRPTGVFRSQRSGIRSTVAAGRTSEAWKATRWGQWARNQQDL